MLTFGWLGGCLGGWLGGWLGVTCDQGVISRKIIQDTHGLNWHMGVNLDFSAVKKTASVGQGVGQWTFYLPLSCCSLPFSLGDDGSNGSTSFTLCLQESLCQASSGLVVPGSTNTSDMPSWHFGQPIDRPPPGVFRKRLQVKNDVNALGKLVPTVFYKTFCKLLIDISNTIY